MGDCPVKVIKIEPSIGMDKGLLSPRDIDCLDSHNRIRVRGAGLQRMARYVHLQQILYIAIPLI